jgi:hypothetical protein
LKLRNLREEADELRTTFENPYEKNVVEPPGTEQTPQSEETSPQIAEESEKIQPAVGETASGSPISQPTTKN